jgi:hypothetical protein
MGIEPSDHAESQNDAAPQDAIPVQDGASAPDELHVFIAHRHEDSEHLGEILAEIRPFCANKVKFFISSEIAAGTNWREWITNNIAKSNQFWLIYTDPVGNWEWPLYEARIFAGLNSFSSEDISRLIYFSTTGEKPDALADFQGITIDEEGLKEFFTAFFHDPNLADGTCINHAISEKNIDDIVDKCLNTVGQTGKTEGSHLYNKYMDLEFSFHGRNAENEDIEVAVISSKSVITDIFGVYELPKNWKDLLDLFDSKESWAEELHEALRSACRGAVFNQPAAHLMGLDDRRAYIPVLHSMKKKVLNSQTKVRAHVIFVKQRERGQGGVLSTA